MANLDGTWIYQSFRRSMAPPSPLVPWSPAGRLSVTTDVTGNVNGKLAIPLPPGAPVPELVLTISGRIKPADGWQLQDGVELTGVGGRDSVNELLGYFVAGGASPVIVGEVTAVKNDPAGEPNGTTGLFVLIPAK